MSLVLFDLAFRVIIIKHGWTYNCSSLSILPVQFNPSSSPYLPCKQSLFQCHDFLVFYLSKTWNKASRSCWRKFNQTKTAATEYHPCLKKLHAFCEFSYFQQAHCGCREYLLSLKSKFLQYKISQNALRIFRKSTYWRLWFGLLVGPVNIK